MSRVASPPALCGMCQRVRTEGMFDDSGAVFICTGCQADGRQFIEAISDVGPPPTERERVRGSEASG